MAKKTKQQHRILALCHTPSDVVGEGACSTVGLPVTMHTLSMTETLDIVGRNKPDYAFDLTKPIPPRFKARLSGRYDVATTVCCPSFVFVRDDGQGLVEQAFANVAHMLKPGGYFIFTTATTGIASLDILLFGKARFSDVTKYFAPAVREEVMSALGKSWARRVDGAAAFRHVDIAEFEAFYRDFVARYATTFLPRSGDRYTYARPLKDLQQAGIIVLQKI